MYINYGFRMSQRNFKILVWVNLVWVVISVLAVYIAPSDLTPILLDELNNGSSDKWTALDLIAAGIILISLICHVALLFFSRWAWLGCIILIPATILVTNFNGPEINSSIDAFTLDVDLFLSGVLWAVLLFTDIKSNFELHNKTIHATSA